MKKIYDYLKEHENFQNCIKSEKSKNDLTLIFPKSANYFDLEDMMQDALEIFPKITYEIEGNLINGFIVKIFNYGD